MGSPARKFFAEPVNFRSRAGRRWKDLLAEIAGALGGLDGLTSFQLHHVRRAIGLIQQLEGFEAALARGHQVDSAVYGSLAKLADKSLRALNLDVEDQATGDHELPFERKFERKDGVGSPLEQRRLRTFLVSQLQGSGRRKRRAKAKNGEARAAR